MSYIENPKTKGSGMICAIPQTGKCPLQCDDCFFQSGRSYLESLDENLPNMPEFQDAIGRVVRINDGNDSNIEKSHVIESTKKYQMKFYNTSIPKKLEEFDAPVVLTINPGKMTNKDFYILNPIPKNLMFVRARTNMWNINKVVIPAVKYYTENEIPVVLTFVAYYIFANTIPTEHIPLYKFKKKTINKYYAINTTPWENIMSIFKYNKWVHSCGKIVGEKGDTHCRFCGNCIREYFATMERIRNG